METNNYLKFKFFDFNRKTDNGLIERLKISLMDFGYIKDRPVMITRNYYVLDGQNRIKACESLKIPVIFEILDVDENDTELIKKIILTLNKNQLIWRLKDYIHSFATDEHPEYLIMEKIYANYSSLGWTNIIRIVGNNKLNGSQIRNGFRFKINPSTYEIINFLSYLKGLPFYQNSHFVGAIVSMWRNTDDFNRKKIIKYRMQIPQCAKTTDYLIVFENIINKGLREDNRITLTNGNKIR